MTLRKATFVAFVIFALVQVWGGVGIIGNGYWAWGLPLLVGAGLIVLGLRQRDDAPRRSTVLLVVGAAIPVVTLFWMAVIFLPVALVLSWMAYATEPGRRDPVVAPAT